MMVRRRLATVLMVERFCSCGAERVRLMASQTRQVVFGSRRVRRDGTCIERQTVTRRSPLGDDDLSLFFHERLHCMKLVAQLSHRHAGRTHCASAFTTASAT